MAPTDTPTVCRWGSIVWILVLFIKRVSEMLHGVWSMEHGAMFRGACTIFPFPPPPPADPPRQTHPGAMAENPCVSRVACAQNVCPCLLYAAAPLAKWVRPLSAEHVRGAHCLHENHDSVSVPRSESAAISCPTCFLRLKGCPRGFQWAKWWAGHHDDFYKPSRRFLDLPCLTSTASTTQTVSTPHTALSIGLRFACPGLPARTRDGPSNERIAANSSTSAAQSFTYWSPVVRISESPLPVGCSHRLQHTRMLARVRWDKACTCRSGRRGRLRAPVRVRLQQRRACPCLRQRLLATRWHTHTLDFAQSSVFWPKSP